METELSCSALIPILRAEFGNLWQCEPKGKTLEIVTPFSTANGHFISLFVTERESDIIITDGGWVRATTYLDDGEEMSDSTANAAINYFSIQYSVQSYKAADGKEYFFKRTQKKEQISAFVHDLANFISGVVNELSYANATEGEQ